jgi:transcriptional regulator with XRE-family HTH domain
MSKGSERDLVRRAYGMAVRNCRQRIGMAQERLALEVGVDRAYMSGLERGKHNPTLLTILRFLPTLQVSFAEFASEFDKCLRRARRDEKKTGRVD